MITPQSFVTFDPPVTLDLAIGRSAVRTPREFANMPFIISIDAARREMRATLSPLPGHLPLYGPDDFAAACADTMEDHAQRILQLLGPDPSSSLQSMIDGAPLPELPPRVPREIQNWRAKAILASMGLLESVEASILAMPEPQRTIVLTAWTAGANLARRGPTVLQLGEQLGMTSSEIDSLFIAAAKIEV